MSVFVTGGSGYLGRNLIRALIARGERVQALARSNESAQTVAALGAVPCRGDLFDEAALFAGLQGCTTCFHSAATVEEWGPRSHFEKVNVTGTASLLAAAKRAAVRTFVHVGTEAAFANGGPMAGLDEYSALPDNPLPRYAATKNAAERLVRAANAPGFTTVVCRPRLIWGADDTSVLPKLLKAVADGQWAWVDGGHYLTSTCHVENVVEGLLLAAEKGQGGGAYFLTDGAPIEFREFFTRVFATQGVQAPNKEVPRWLVRPLAATLEALWERLPLPGAPPLTRMSIALGTQAVTVSDALARRDLGYVGHVSLAQGLADLAQRHGR